jgi:hypothetical protein
LFNVSFGQDLLPVRIKQLRVSFAASIKEQISLTYKSIVKIIKAREQQHDINDINEKAPASADKP